MQDLRGVPVSRSLLVGLRILVVVIVLQLRGITRARYPDTAHEIDRAGAAGLAHRTRRGSGRSTVPDHHRPPAQPGRGRTPPRRPRRDRPADLPFAGIETSRHAHPAAFGADETIGIGHGRHRHRTVARTLFRIPPPQPASIYTPT